jgi:hypothetical protein
LAWLARAERRVEVGRGFRQVNDLQLVSNEVLETARDICDRIKLTPFTPLNPETLRQLTLKHCAN